MIFNEQTIKEYTPSVLKNADPKEYLLYIANSLNLSAKNKAKFFMWLDFDNYEITAQEDEALEHLVKENLSTLKKSQTDEFKDIPYIDEFFYKAIEKTNAFVEYDTIGLCLTLLGYISFKSNLLDEEEYLEIRDLLVPYKLMISQCKIKDEVLFNNFKEVISDYNGSVRLLTKLGKGVVCDMPGDDLIKDAFKEITYDKDSWEKE